MCETSIEVQCHRCYHGPTRLHQCVLPVIVRRKGLKNKWLHLLLWIALSSSSILAQDFKRFEFQPFGGFTTTGGIPIESEDNVSASIHVDSSYHAGAAFNIYVNELDAIGVMWQRHFTEGRLPSEIFVPSPSVESARFNLHVDQYHVDFIHHYRIMNPDTLPYIMAGLGATTYFADRDGRSDSKSYFSFALGGGVKYFFNSHFGFRGEARWSPTVLSTSDSSFWCNIGGDGAMCDVRLKASLQHQLDLTGGLVFRF